MELAPVHVCQSTLAIHIQDVVQNACRTQIVIVIRLVQTIDVKIHAQELAASTLNAEL